MPSLNCHLKMVKMVNSTLYIFGHNKNTQTRKERRLSVPASPAAPRPDGTRRLDFLLPDPARIQVGLFGWGARVQSMRKEAAIPREGS